MHFRRRRIDTAMLLIFLLSVLPVTCAKRACGKTCLCVLGECTSCKQGYFGNKCNRRCQDSKCKFDACPYINEMSVNIFKDGLCRRGCRKGWYGILCDKRCRDCPTGRCDKAKGYCEGGCRFNCNPITYTQEKDDTDPYEDSTSVTEKLWTQHMGFIVGLVMCLSFLSVGFAILHYRWFHNSHRGDDTLHSETSQGIVENDLPPSYEQWTKPPPRYSKLYSHQELHNSVTGHLS